MEKTSIVEEASTGFRNVLNKIGGTIKMEV